MVIRREARARAATSERERLTRPLRRPILMRVPQKSPRRGRATDGLPAGISLSPSRRRPEFTADPPAESSPRPRGAGRALPASCAGAVRIPLRHGPASRHGTDRATPVALSSQRRASSAFPRRCLARASHSQLSTARPGFGSARRLCSNKRAASLEPAGPVVQGPLLGQRPELSGGGLELLLGQAAGQRRVRDGVGGQGAGAGHVVGPQASAPCRTARPCGRTRPAYPGRSPDRSSTAAYSNQKWPLVRRVALSRSARSSRRPCPIPGVRRAQGPAPPGRRR